MIEKDIYKGHVEECLGCVVENSLLTVDLSLIPMISSS